MSAGQGIQYIIIDGTLHIEGGEFDDELTGSPDAEWMRGRGGSDTLFGENGDDTLLASDGFDILYGGAGDDLLVIDNSFEFGSYQYFGGEGNDTLEYRGYIGWTFDGLVLDAQASVEIFDSGNPIWYGDRSIAGSADSSLFDLTGITSYANSSAFGLGSGNDTFRGSGLAEYVNGNADDDLIYGNGGNDTLHGVEGTDTIYGGDGDDLLSGSFGNDILYGGDGDDILVLESYSTVQYFGGAGTDALQTGGLRIESLILDSTASVEILAGALPEQVSLEGSDASNLFDITGIVSSDDESPDVSLGGGNDTFRGSGLAEVVGGNADNDLLYGNGGNDTLFGNDGSDTLFGGDGDDGLEGGIGNDLIYGDGGNDTLEGGEGSDWIDGGDGDDVLVASANSSHQYFGGAGNDTLLVRYAALEGLVLNTLASVETIEVSSSVSGSTAANLFDVTGVTNYLGLSVFSLGEGNDTFRGSDVSEGVYGHEDNDLLYGNGGNDTLFGNDGSDTLFGGDGDDGLEGGIGNDLIYAGVGDDLVYGGTGNDVLYGGNQNDVLLGDAGRDWLFGGDFDDVLQGGAGNDLLWGEGGADQILGGVGRDNLFGGTGNDTIYGEAGNDTLRGEVGNDQMFGGAGRDRLFGGTGDDTIDGGAGNDTLTSGAGRDIFVFEDRTGRDRILDFQRGFDSVDLTYYNATWAEVRGALRMSGGIVQLDLAKLGGYGLVDFVTEKRLALFTADDFIL